jgi:hypothetical protein
LQVFVFDAHMSSAKITLKIERVKLGKSTQERLLLAFQYLYANLTNVLFKKKRVNFFGN